MKYAFKPGDRPLDGYTIKRAIGRGGFGEVYYAVSEAGKEVALKLLQQDIAVELRGIRQCLNLQHPNLVAIFDVRQDADGDYWIIMEYVAGPTLADFIAEHPDGVSLPEVLDWLQPVAEGLQYLHERGIVHRDIKPANVYRSGRLVKVGDCGLAKFIAPSRRSAHTHSVGTVHYMAPEVARGSYGPEVDVYALGAIAYEMLTGRVPFDGETTAEILMRHLTDTPDWSLVPRSVRPVLEAALEKDPHRRTASTRTFVEQLKTAAEPNAGGAAVCNRTAVAGSGAGNFDGGDRMSATTAVRAARRVNGHGGERRRFTEADLAEAFSTQTHAAVEGSADSEPVAIRVRHEPREPDDEPQTARGERAEVAVAGPPRAAGRRKNGARVWVVLAIATVAWLALTGRLPGRTLLWIPLSASLVYQLLVFAITRFAFRGESTAREPQRSESQAAGVRPSAARELHAGGRFDITKPVSPEWPRRIDAASRFLRFAAACPVALVCVAVLTAAFNELAYPLGDWPHVAYFGVTACLGAWGLLLLGTYWEGRVYERELRRLTYVCAGALFGLFAWWLHETWLLELRASFGLFSQLGQHPLVRSGGAPTWENFVLVFALLFGLRRWWWHTDALRPRRFRVLSVVLTGMLAALLAGLFTFPMAWSVLWAATVSSAVQLASTWSLPDFEAMVRESRRRGYKAASMQEVRS